MNLASVKLPNPTSELPYRSEPINEEIAAWLDPHGTPKTAAEVKAWSDSVETINPY